MNRIAALSSSLALALSLAGLAPAKAQPEGTWAVLVSTEGESTSARGLTETLHDALAEQGASVISDTAVRLERISRPAEEVSQDRVQALRREVDQVTRHLALGEIKQAIDRLTRMEALHAAALDHLNREVAQAQKLFGACVMTGYLLYDSGERLPGEARMRYCASTFPGFELPKDEFADKVRRAYDTVRKQIEDNPVRLFIEQRGHRKTCLVRLNGVDLGPPPVGLPARESTVRVQMECDEKPGRVHEVTLKSGRNTLYIDPGLDRSLRVAGPWVLLAYDDGQDLARTGAHAVELGRAFEVDHVLQLVVTGSGETRSELRWIDVHQKQVVAQERWRGQRELPGAVSALLGQPSAVSAGAGKAQSGAKPRKLIGGGEPPGALYWVGTGALWTVGPVLTMVGLNERSALRKRAAGVVFATPDPALRQQQIAGLDGEYSDWFAIPMLVSGIANAGSATMLLLGLPEANGTPVWAWGLGVLGVGLAAAGATHALAVDHCELGLTAAECGHWARDDALGPLLMVNAITPLTAPLTYLITGGSSDRPSVQTQMYAGDGVFRFDVRGSF